MIYLQAFANISENFWKIYSRNFGVLQQVPTVARRSRPSTTLASG